jgi:hypothetical protein
MAEIDRAYMTVALVLLIAGMLLGFYMGVAADNQLLTLHVGMLLPGFVTLAIYGFIFRLWPAMKKSALARVQFWLAMIGALGLLVGSYLFITAGQVAIAAIGSVLYIAAAVLLAWQFWTQASEAT